MYVVYFMLNAAVMKSFAQIGFGVLTISAGIFCISNSKSKIIIRITSLTHLISTIQTTEEETGYEIENAR